MKLKQKLMAAILVVMMLAGYVATLTDAVIAAGISLAEQNGKTNHVNVEFNSYFAGEEHSKIFELGKEAKLYLKLKVSNTGYLKNGVVQFLDANFEVDSNSLKNDKIQNSSKDKINLKQINNGEEFTIEVPLTMITGEKIDKDFFHKTSIVKFTGTYMDENGKEKSIEKEISNQLNWRGTAKVELAGEISKYLPYQVGNEKGVLIQARIRSNLKDNQLPVAKTKLEVSLPEIGLSSGSVKPERITVIANTTAGTNDKANYEFSEENYTYNSETNKIEIVVENKEENGKIAWNKNAADEYLVNFIYLGEAVYEQVQTQLEKAKQTMKTEEEITEGQVNENAIIGEIEVKAGIETYSSEKTHLEQSGKINYHIEQAKGELVDVNISTIKKLSKGYMYANLVKAEKEAKKQNIEAKKETTYEVNYTVQIQDKTFVSGMEFQTVTPKYMDKEENKYNIQTHSKTVKIAENIFNKMLGEEGKIEIFNKSGDKLAELTNNLEKDSNGYYTVDIANAKVNEIIIKTTKPISEGNIEIIVEKAILANQKYSKEEIENFNKITEGIQTKAYNTVVESKNEEEHIEVTKEIIVADNKKETKISLIEPVSKAEISVGTQNLSTIVENKDVEMRVVLDTSSNENALYKNPTFQIMLPENIEKLNIKSVDLLLEDELKIKETKVVEQNGRKVILLTLTGTQTKYMDNGASNKKEVENVISKGANIVIKADITFKKLTPSANSNIYLYYTNENTDLFEKYYQNPNLKSNGTANTVTMGLATTGIQIISPNGVVAENHMSGFKSNTNISNTTGTQQTENIDAHGAAKEVTIGGSIVNNYNNSIENVFVLGRIPFNGNKAVDSATDLGSNFTMKLKSKMTTSGIDSSKVKVYYSTNGEATKDLNAINSNNGWTENPSNMAEVKSYLIVISGEVAKGTQFDFDYKTELPANLSYSQTAYSNYKVYYDNKMPDATLGETKIAGVVGLTTGQGPELQVNVTSSSKTVREGQIVRMTATIKNVGGLTAENAKLLITAPEGTVHTEIPEGMKAYIDSNNKEKAIALGNIKAGETITREYELRIKKGKKTETITNSDGTTQTIEKNEYPGDKELQNIVKVSADNMSNDIQSEAYTFTVLKGDLEIINTPNVNETSILQNGYRVRYTIQVKNISYDKDLNNVTLNITIPNGVKVSELYYSDTFTFNEKKTDNIITNGNNISINLGKLQSSILYWSQISGGDHENTETGPQQKVIRETVYILMEVELENFSGVHEFLMNAKADETEAHYSNSKKLVAEAVNFKLEQKALDNQYVKEGSEYTYHFTVENTGKVASYSNIIEMPIPEGIKLVNAKYTYDGETKTTASARDGKLTINIYSLEAGAKVDLVVTVKANLLPDKNDKEIITKASISARGFETIESNTVKAIIEYDEDAHKVEQPGGNTPGGNTPGGSTPSGSYKITGTAWIDENRNGQRDESEEILAGVQVVLLYKANSQIVKDATTGAEKITTTNANGKYEFTNLKPGEYLVLFLYDAGKYSITDYQKQGVADSVNSDATNMKIVLNGEQRQAGVSNTIKITNAHVRDIDIGLFVAEKFDLRLDKYISKITVTTPSNGTKVYNYNNSKMTKREIASKDVGKSSLVVEYKIVVTNEGQVEGFVKKIIDYLPEDAKFSSELNKDWYLSDNNGAVYNTALENEKIAPGQSKEVKLVLSFNINNKNIGKMINNNAEIYESYNELGLEDIDSIPANRLESEDDMSSADIMLSVATGKVIIYTTFVLAVVALLGFGIFEIKKRVLTEKKN